MKRAMRYALIFCLILLCFTACADNNTGELLQTEHIPGEEHAAVYTATPSPVVQDGADVTPTEVTAATPVPTMPLVPTMPELPEEEPEFIDLYRAMPEGTRVNTEGVPEEQVRYCFYHTGLTEHLKNEVTGQGGLIKAESPGMVRALYYKGDGKSYVCDVIAEDTECEDIKNLFYQMYQEKQMIDDWTALPDEMISLGYEAVMISINNAEYLYVYK